MIQRPDCHRCCNNRRRRRHASLLLFVILLSPLALSSRARGATPALGVADEDASSLVATSAVPWNPATPIPSRRPWERAVLLPGQIISLPFSGLGYVTNHALLKLEQNTRAFTGSRGSHISPVRGFRPGWSGFGDRTGIGLVSELHSPVLGGPFKSRVSAQYAGTTLLYNSTSFAIVGRPLGLQYSYEWRPQDQYYGVGPGSATDSLAGYAMQQEVVRASLRWTWDASGGLKPPGTSLALWGGPRSQVTRTGREAGRVSYDVRFPSIGAATLDQRFENFVYGVSLGRDRRAGHPHWTQGERVLLAAERYDDPIPALALHDGHGTGARFTRYSFESEVGFSFMRDPRSVRLFVKGIDEQVAPGGNPLSISDMSKLGGHEGLMGFTPGRFHDFDLLLARVSYLFPILRGLEVDLHSEWGSVYHDVWNDPKLNTLQSSVGFTVRFRSALKPRASAGLEFSRESIRFRYSLGGLE